MHPHSPCVTSAAPLPLIPLQIRSTNIALHGRHPLLHFLLSCDPLSACRSLRTRLGSSNDVPMHVCTTCSWQAPPPGGSP